MITEINKSKVISTLSLVIVRLIKFVGKDEKIKNSLVNISTRLMYEASQSSLPIEINQTVMLLEKVVRKLDT